MHTGYLPIEPDAHDISLVKASVMKSYLHCYYALEYLNACIHLIFILPLNNLMGVSIVSHRAKTSPP